MVSAVPTGRNRLLEAGASPSAQGPAWVSGGVSLSELLLYCLSGLLVKERAVVPSFQDVPDPCHQQAAALVGWGGGGEMDTDLSMGSGEKCLQLSPVPAWL